MPPLDLPTTEAALGTAETAMRPYETPELPQQTRQAVMKEWSPLLQRSVGETQRMMGEFLPRFMDIPYQGLAAGTTAASLTPQQKMGLMGRELGGMAGRLTASGSLSDYLGGKASEMAQNAMQAIQYGQQSAAQAYNRAFQRYQMAFQAAEAEKSRAMQRSLAAKPQWPDIGSLLEQLLGGGAGAGAGARIMERPGVAERIGGMAQARGVSEDLLRNMASEIAQTTNLPERGAIYRRYLEMIPMPQQTPLLQRQMQAIASGKALF